MAELPELQAIWEDYRSDSVEVIAVNLQEPVSVVAPIAGRYDYLFLMDADASSWNLYVQGGYIPLNYVLDNDENQTVIGWMEGFNDGQVREWIDSAITDRPKLLLEGFVVIDSLENDDGRPDPGETVSMVVTLANATGFEDAESVSVTLTTDDTSLAIGDSMTMIPYLAGGTTASNDDDPFVFDVLPCSSHWADFQLRIDAPLNDYSVVRDFRTLIGRPWLIVVDDDQGEGYEEYYFSALDSLGVVYDCSNWLQTQPHHEFDKYETVIWLTGNDSLSTLSQEEMDSLSNFLDGGGNLFISGQNIGEDIGSEPFYSNYLHAQWTGTAAGKYFLDGVPGDEVGDGLSLVILGAGGASNQISQDVLLPVNGADSVLTYSGGGVAGVKYGASYKVVYFGFGFEAINDIVVGWSHRPECLKKILNWFGYPVTGVNEDIHIATESVIPMRISPNPCVDRTFIQYQLGAGSNVHLVIFNLLGQEIKVLLHESQDAGLHTVAWDGRDESGRVAPNGPYFLKLRAVTVSGGEIHTVTKKLSLMR